MVSFLSQTLEVVRHMVHLYKSCINASDPESSTKARNLDKEKQGGGLRLPVDSETMEVRYSSSSSQRVSRTTPSTEESYRALLESPCNF